MKIRNGFVSNSSSSSYIISGDEVSILDIDLKKGEYCAIGKCLSEGVDVIEIDSEEKIYSLLLAMKNNYDFKIIKVKNKEFDPDICEILNISDDEYWDISDDEIQERMIQNNIDGHYLWIDHHSSDDLNDIIYHYDIDKTLDEIKKETINYLRKIKLKKILK